jgi:hypothetical protein
MANLRAVGSRVGQRKPGPVKQLEGRRVQPDFAWIFLISSILAHRSKITDLLGTTSNFVG